MTDNTERIAGPANDGLQSQVELGVVLSTMAEVRHRIENGEDVDYEQFADILFYDKFRKATGLPYAVHLKETMKFVGEVTDDPRVKLAALFHDWIEDVGDRLTQEEAEVLFGADVVRWINGVTKDMTIENWHDGWREFMAKIANAEEIEILQIELADRTSNLRDSVGNSLRQGRKFWNIFKTSTPEDHLWMNREMYKILAERLEPNALLDEYHAYIDTLAMIVQVYKDNDEQDRDEATA